MEDRLSLRCKANRRRALAAAAEAVTTDHVEDISLRQLRRRRLLRVCRCRRCCLCLLLSPGELHLRGDVGEAERDVRLGELRDLLLDERLHDLADQAEAVVLEELLRVHLGQVRHLADDRLAAGALGRRLAVRLGQVKVRRGERVQAAHGDARRQSRVERRHLALGEQAHQDHLLVRLDLDGGDGALARHRQHQGVRILSRDEVLARRVVVAEVEPELQVVERVHRPGGRREGEEGGITRALQEGHVADQVVRVTLQDQEHQVDVHAGEDTRTGGWGERRVTAT